MPRLVTSKSFLAITVAGVAGYAAWWHGAGTWFDRGIQAGEVEVYFSPNGGCTEAVVRAIGAAKQSVHVQAYSFTSAPIAAALVQAHRRGVKTEVILDKSQETEKYSEADFLQHAGVPVYIDRAHAIAHNKLMIVDQETVITGSFNFTKAGEQRNAENLLILHQTPALAEKYLSNWRAHQRHSPAHRRR